MNPSFSLIIRAPLLAMENDCQLKRHIVTVERIAMAALDILNIVGKPQIDENQESSSCTIVIMSKDLRKRTMWAMIGFSNIYWNLLEH